jgi:hypothetical protein
MVAWSSGKKDGKNFSGEVTIHGNGPQWCHAYILISASQEIIRQ